MSSGDCYQQDAGSGLSTCTASDGAVRESDASVSASGKTDKAEMPGNKGSTRTNASCLPSAELRRQVGVRWPAEPFYVHISKSS